MQKKSFNKITTAATSAVVLFFICFFTSGYIVERLGSAVTEIWPSRIFLQAVKNQNFVFSLPLSNAASILVSIAVLCLVNWIYCVSEKRAFGFFAGYALIMGGALSNLFSRVEKGFVWDSFIVIFFGVQGAWNLADCFIIAGMLFWVYDFIRFTHSTIS